MFKLSADALGLAGQWHPCSQATSATPQHLAGPWGVGADGCLALLLHPDQSKQVLQCWTNTEAFLGGLDTNISLLFLFFLDLHNVCIVSMAKKNSQSPTEQCVAALFALMAGSLASPTSCSSATPLFPCKLSFTALSPVFSPCTGWHKTIPSALTEICTVRHDHRVSEGRGEDYHK